MELADEALDGCGFSHQVPENEVSKASIREFISTSIAPYISSALESSHPLLQELLTAAADEEQDTAILTSISSQAALHGDEELVFGNIGRRDIEPYYPWTIPSSLPLSADHNPVFNFSSLDGGAFIPVLQEPFVPGWTSSRKGKEILEQPVPTSLQLEYLEKLRRHPSSIEDMLPSTATASSSPPSRDSVWLSSFERYRHSQLLTRSSTKRPSMIYKWVTALAPLMRAGPGGGGERDGGLSSDPRSPNSRMLDHQAAVIHKHAERRRRSNMNNKLRTLISIVPTIDKKKDKISVLSSTIDYIRQLTSRISSFENKGEGASTSGMKEDALDFTKVISSIAGAPNVVVESMDEKTWLIKVQANYHPWSLLHILNMFQDLGFEVTSMDYSTMDGRFGTNISIKHPKNSNTSCSDLKDILSRGLESSNNLRTNSN